ncbi:MAG: peptidoglycan DD-metalloendopeptidase family protein [Defluviitaleaceae bacterium]|nr:peptidoglycan DD-metalloendopeptidase family protein [Defluviitaleaceae bacterium]
MFLKKNLQVPPTIKVKKASDIIKNGSHKQKKYLSLMLVPSYTTGKTRSLRIPRALFYCVLIFIFAVSAVIAGLQIRADYLRHMARHYSTQLSFTEEQFREFRHDTEAELDEWIAANADLAEQLGDEIIDRRRAEISMQRNHQGSLNEVQDYLNELERQIQEFEEKLNAAVTGLTHRTFIPAIANLLEQLSDSQAQIRAAFLPAEPLYENGYTNGYEIAADTANSRMDGVVGLAATSLSLSLPPTVTQSDIHTQIAELLSTLEMLTELKEDMQYYRERIQPYCDNYPTLWPVRAAISSGFGRRRCPFGSGQWQQHTGVDIPSPAGTSIRAAGGGVVTFAGWASGGLGNMVVIDHGNGIQTLYAHNRANLVTVGQRVARGDIIARVGTTGSTTGPHVHYEVHVNGRPVNPRQFLLE